MLNLKLIFGTLSVVFTYFFMSDLDNQQRVFLSIFAFVVFNWLFTQIPLYITGFIGVCFSIIFQIAPAKEIFANFANPIIYLFLGGFILARAFNQVGLDRRIALFLLSRKIINGSVYRLLFALMFLTATFTMWISNTATTAMMLPLVLGVLNHLEIKDKKVVGLILLSIAYASSVGGIATPVGSTPNIIGIGMLSEIVNIKVNFFEWMLYGLPIATIFLVVLYLLISFELKKFNIKIDTSYLCEQYKKLAKISKQEIIVLGCFSLTVFFWLLPSLLKAFAIKIGFSFDPGAVAILFSSMLFILTVEGKPILKSQDIKTIDWGSLLLFGSGLVFGTLLFDLGLASLIGNSIIELISGMPLFFILLFIFGFVIFSTELTSNTATANILIPIMISMALKLNLSPMLMTMGIAFSCSLAFMLPVATPPNTIVYGSEMVEKSDMLKLGLVLNIVYTIILASIFWGISFFV